ncbi:MAG TPA: hypothetical protein VG674_07185 [Amycolatopsis sp.]|nr:hypothetical protein [Amycolatopsis sp.]
MTPSTITQRRTRRPRRRLSGRGAGRSSRVTGLLTIAWVLLFVGVRPFGQV